MQSCCVKRFGKKNSQKTLKFSNCRQSTGKQIQPSCGKIFHLLFTFVWFPESNEIWRLCSKCLGKELPLPSMFYVKKEHFCKGQKGLSTSLALQCYTGLVGSRLPYKIKQEITTGDKDKLFVLFIPLHVFTFFLFNYCRMCAPCVVTWIMFYSHYFGLIFSQLISAMGEQHY